jgi:hypothetical protein
MVAYWSCAALLIGGYLPNALGMCKMRMHQNGRRQPFFKIALLLIGGILPLEKISVRRHAFLHEISDQFIGRSINEVLPIGISGEVLQGKNG